MSGRPGAEVPAGHARKPSDGPVAGSVFVTTPTPALPVEESRPANHEIVDRSAADALGWTPPAQGGINTRWYRPEHQRARSVYRRANPWYRRLARTLLALALVASGGVALYFGARVLQDYLNRDRLPSVATEAAGFRSTSVLINSVAPAPALNGTLTIDETTRAFEFVDVGSGDGTRPSVTVVSPDGTRMFIREASGDWRAAGGTDDVANELTRAIPYVLAVDGPNDILLSRMRAGYVELDDKAVEGIDDTALDRYQMSIDTSRFAADQPLQWLAFQQEVVPGATESGDAVITMWIDTNNVVTRLLDAQTGWGWQRLAYGDGAFDPDPTGEIAAAAG